MTLYELELLMRGLSKHVPETAQILFGTSVDPAMAESLSVTLVSSLPEDRLRADFSKSVSAKKAETFNDKGTGESESSEEGLPEDEGSLAETTDPVSNEEILADNDSSAESGQGSSLVEQEVGQEV